MVPNQGKFQVLLRVAGPAPGRCGTKDCAGGIQFGGVPKNPGGHVVGATPGSIQPCEAFSPVPWISASIPRTQGLANCLLYPAWIPPSPPLSLGLAAGDSKLKIP